MERAGGGSFERPLRRGWTPRAAGAWRLVLGAGVLLLAAGGCALFRPATPAIRPTTPLTASTALGLADARRDASLRLVIAGLDEDAAGRSERALARYERAVRVDATNPFAYLALARHHLESRSVDEASAFLDQARARFEAEDRLGPDVAVWGLGLRAGIDRARGREAEAEARFEEARRLAPGIWDDERLSATELR